jgi:hypothetical protein
MDRNCSGYDITFKSNSGILAPLSVMDSIEEFPNFEQLLARILSHELHLTRFKDAQTKDVFGFTEEEWQDAYLTIIAVDPFKDWRCHFDNFGERQPESVLRYGILGQLIALYSDPRTADFAEFAQEGETFDPKYFSAVGQYIRQGEIGFLVVEQDYVCDSAVKLLDRLGVLRSELFLGDSLKRRELTGTPWDWDFDGKRRTSGN